MKKEEVCILIDSDEKLTKAIELLIKYNQVIDREISFSTDGWLRWLKFFDAHSGWYIGLRQSHLFTEVKLSELEEILNIQ